MSLGDARKLINRVVIAHTPITLAANRTQIINIECPTFALRDIMTHLECKWRHDILAPGHETLMLKEPIATPQKPDLLSKSSRYISLHIFIIAC
jgi:hypothetical protein